MMESLPYFHISHPAHKSILISSTPISTHAYPYIYFQTPFVPEKHTNKFLHQTKQKGKREKAEMGNAVGRSKKAKVMKVDGETFKLKTPARVNDVVKDHPGHVLLDSEAVKHFGVRAKPLEPHQELKPKRIYFLLELPKVQPPEPQLARRVRSTGIQGMNAKDRLEFLMLSKRSVSDLTLVKKPPSSLGLDGPRPNHEPMRVKMRIPKAQLEMLMEENPDETQVAEKIINLYMANNAGEAAVDAKAELGGKRDAHKPRGKRVSFSSMEEGEIRVGATSQ